MGDTAFVLGNGESRRGIQIEEFKAHGTVYACNGVYRTDTPHYLVAVDPKMLLEIGETEYAVHNKVWSNYNAQYANHKRILDYVQWFKPSLGWSSGPTALRMACDHGYKDIYILGFDYQGHSQGAGFKFNNVFKDTRNYKRAKDEATFYGNWMNQTKRCLKDFPLIKFHRVIPKDWFTPKDLAWNQNLSHPIKEDFVKQFNLTVKS